MIGPKYTVVEVLRDQWWVGVVALIVTLVATPILRAIAYRMKIVDRPDEALKPHARPVAYLGGVAMCAGLLAGLAGYVGTMPGLAGHWAEVRALLAGGRIFTLRANPLWNVSAIALAGTVVMVVGLLDDLRDMRPRQKILGQMLAAGLLLAGGVGDHMAGMFFTTFDVQMPVGVLFPLSAVMCLGAVIAACNATNLLDGLDGLCGGVTGVIAMGFLALAVWLAVWGRYPGTDELRIGLCLAMAGAVFGFLPYNVPPASIFMGDAGSMLLGFFVATMMALFCQEGNARWFVATMVVFALPILDTALAVVRRIVAGRSLFAGDRSHLYDQLVDRGMTVKQVVVLFYVLALAAAVLGVSVAIYLRGRYAVILYAVLLAAIWLTFWKLGMIRPGRDETGPDAADEQAPSD